MEEGWLQRFGSWVRLALRLEPPAAPRVELRRLDEIPPGSRIVLRALQGDAEMNGRFMQLGLVVGSAAEVLLCHADGPLLIRSRGGLVAIGRLEARNILVEMSS